MNKLLHIIWEHILWLPHWSFGSVFHYLICGIVFYLLLSLSFMVVEHDKNTADELRAGAGGFYGLGTLFTLLWPVYLIIILFRSFQVVIAFLFAIAIILAASGFIQFVSQ